MNDHINTTCCKRHTVELLNAFPDDHEVERLRWSLKNADEDHDVLRAEVERLREQVETWKDAHDLQAFARSMLGRWV